MLRSGLSMPRQIPVDRRANPSQLTIPDGASTGLFCCGGPANGSTDHGTTCIYSSHGSNKPFTLDAGWVLYPNTSQTLDDYEAAHDTIVSKKTSDRTTAIGAGLGVGLGVSLIVAILAFLWQVKKARALRRQLKEYDSAQQCRDIQHPIASAPKTHELSEHGPPVYEASHSNERRELAAQPAQLP